MLGDKNKRRVNFFLLFARDNEENLRISKGVCDYVELRAFFCMCVCVCRSAIRILVSGKYLTVTTYVFDTYELLYMEFKCNYRK